MSLVEKLVNIVNIEVEEPAAFGGFHFACIFSVVILSVLLSRSILYSRPRALRLFIIISFFVMLTLEVVKEVGLSFVYVDGLSLLFTPPSSLYRILYSIGIQTAYKMFSLSAPIL